MFVDERALTFGLKGKRPYEKQVGYLLKYNLNLISISEMFINISDTPNQVAGKQIKGRHIFVYAQNISM